ncbi:MAG TPA: ATP-binding cassette domain-containing protein [Streptosporangiaceae bacterium]
MAIRPGLLVRLDGVNGSGKSTLQRVIAGAAVPTAGKIAGRPVTGYVPERFPPALPFSPREYLTHLGGMYGLRGKALPGRIDECLARLGAAEYADIPFRRLSQGTCQKAAIAQALLPHPGLLVLDEAWTGLDAAARESLDAIVIERVAEGGTVIFVDHDTSRLAALPQQRLELSGGQLHELRAPLGGAAALTSAISPASAALRGSGAVSQGSSWLPGLPLGVAVALIAIAWAASAAAARRG